MSKKDVAVVEPQETAVTFFPINDVPSKAPAPLLDLSNPNLSFDDLFPSNYFSMEDLDAWLREYDAESRVLTVTGGTIEYVYDPEKGEETGEYKFCLSFAEVPTMLVINKSRGQQLRQMTGSPFPRVWITVGRIAIKPGISNGKAQIIITAVPGSDPVPANGSGKDWNSHTDNEIDEMFSYNK
jgi:hypothetical protein